MTEVMIMKAELDEEAHTTRATTTTAPARAANSLRPSWLMGAHSRSGTGRMGHDRANGGLASRRAGPVTACSL